MTIPKINEKQKRRDRYSWIVWGIIIIVIYGWCFSDMKFSHIQESAGTVSKSIFMGLIHPDWAYIYNGSGEDLVSQLIMTLAIAFLGTIIAAIISVPFAFFASRSKNSKYNVTSKVGTFLLTAIRAFPEIVLAIMFIKAVGPGSFAGIMALGIHSIGMLGKLFSESIEEMNHSSEYSIVAAGGSKPQVFALSTWPTILPALISYTLYSFEISVRSASILGLVGAGGIGAPMIMALNTRNWPRVGIILFGIVVMVMVIDGCSGYIRKKLV
ncbi:phosphonate ABC transporter, permease protein PhnE [Fructilactobacillus fructivorans]|uniref:phosphonate ABC transporter, permease protein PhnE n=1 Tax=Fructilactobacillus fructivorans TaxID=1614 RepID=UPI00071583E5|nr:phosphonate ABC transporter, permease protein PhnE [Fructilactobacillus fructivorans]KRN41267.1 ABC-type phosphate phosphonate transport system, permease component [Fructilactobacillus fructivorans]KRN43082.1 ABC-type phosphate phosphonate transport system, permease component [Fructilactobacillus fructivorans]